MHIQLHFPILLIHGKTDEWLSFLPQLSLVPRTFQVNRIALLTCSDHGPHPYHIGQRLSNSRCTRPFWDILSHLRTTSLAACMAWSCTPAASDCAGHSSGFSTLSCQNSGSGWVFQSSFRACFPHILYLFSYTDDMQIFLFRAVISSLESTSQHILPPLSPLSLPCLSNWHYPCGKSQNFSKFICSWEVHTCIQWNIIISTLIFPSNSLLPTSSHSFSVWSLRISNSEYRCY